MLADPLALGAHRVPPWPGSSRVCGALGGELLQRGPDPRLRGPERDLLDRADLARRVAEQRRQDQRPALLGGQRGERLAQLGRLVGRLGAAGRSSTAPARASAIALGSSGSVRRERRWSIARLRVIESSQVDDPAAARVVGGGVSPGPREGLLRDLLGDRAVAGHRHREAEHPRLEAAHERGRGAGVAGGEARRPALHRKATTFGTTDPAAGGIGAIRSPPRPYHPIRVSRPSVDEEAIRAPQAP